MGFQRVRLAFFANFDYDDIRGLRACVRDFEKVREESINSQIELKRLERDVNEDMERFEYWLWDCEGEFLEALNGLTDELCILALYKKLEIKTAKLLKAFYPKLDASKLHKIDYLKKKLGFDITMLSGYPSMDELRLINNAIKHAGVVSQPLANKYPTWVAGDPLINLDEAFQRLAPGVESYFKSLCAAIERDLKL